VGYFLCCELKNAPYHCGVALSLCNASGRTALGSQLAHLRSWSRCRVDGVNRSLPRVTCAAVCRIRGHRMVELMWWNLRILVDVRLTHRASASHFDVIFLSLTGAATQDHALNASFPSNESISIQRSPRRAIRQALGHRDGVRGEVGEIG
jgi:hypothetical protein